MLASVGKSFSTIFLQLIFLKISSLEKKLTKSIIAWILTSNKSRTCNVRDTKRTIRIVGNKLYIKKDIEQGELDYEFEDEIRNNSTNT